ncbi:hypothetical protein EDB86DRAFT_1275694 [Lactarius hatsudake]|nr:hypothetical protein EDB86DRAFT_1275694 [Lactarius hatsudake]
MSSKSRRFHYRMVYDGLGYFVVLAVVNTINAILFRTHNGFIQLYAAPWGGVATWIISQRILINLQGAAAERLSTESPPYVYRSTHTPSTRGPQVESIISNRMEPNRFKCASIALSLSVWCRVTGRLHHVLSLSARRRSNGMKD